MTAQEQPAYLIATLELSDPDMFMRDYSKPVFPTITEAGGEVLIATPIVDVLEGSYKASWTAVLKFPSMEALKTWYSSDRYQALIPIRQSLSSPDSSILIAATGFAGLSTQAE
ncbi:MAG: DUF1330 domain-containing protein [Microcoleaceae cyanobacterium]